VRVAIVVNSAWAAYNFRLNLAQELTAAGYEVLFIFPFDGYYSRRISVKFKCYDLAINSRSMSPLKDIRIVIGLLSLYARLTPSIVCHFTIKPNIYGAFAARVRGIPSICNITGLGTLFIRQSFATYIAKILYRTSLSCCSKVFFQNSADMNYFIENKLISKSVVDILPGSGVDIRRFRPIGNRSVNSNRVVFLMISRLLRDKGVYEFIDAIKIISEKFQNLNIVFNLLGKMGSGKSGSIGQTEVDGWVDSGLVNYLGVTDRVEEVIAESDCVVLPSYREGVPRSVLEAFAMGVPAIVSDVPGCRDIVDNHINGLICRAKSSDDLAKKMIKIAVMPADSRREMGARGRKKVEQFFDEHIVTNTYVDVINAIVEDTV